MIAAFVASSSASSRGPGRAATAAVKWVGGLMFALALAGLATRWPVRMCNSTPGAVTSQFAMLVLGAAVSGLLAHSSSAWSRASARGTPGARRRRRSGRAAAVGGGDRRRPALPPVSSVELETPARLRRRCGQRSPARRSGRRRPPRCSQASGLSPRRAIALVRPLRGRAPDRRLDAAQMARPRPRRRPAVRSDAAQGGTNLATASSLAWRQASLRPPCCGCCCVYDARLVPAYLRPASCCRSWRERVQDGTPAATPAPPPNGRRHGRHGMARSPTSRHHCRRGWRQQRTTASSPSTA